MSRKPFTEEEMTILRQSKYVLNVTPSTVHFSVAFKERFWQAILDGKKPRHIIIELGLDPEILGDIRISGLKGMIKQEVKRGQGFRDWSMSNGVITQFMSKDQQIAYLEQQLAYKDQELAFLKKIASLSQEGMG